MGLLVAALEERPPQTVRVGLSDVVFGVFRGKLRRSPCEVNPNNTTVPISDNASHFRRISREGRKALARTLSPPRRYREPITQKDQRAEWGYVVFRQLKAAGARVTYIDGEHAIRTGYREETSHCTCLRSSQRH